MSTISHLRNAQFFKILEIREIRCLAAIQDHPQTDLRKQRRRRTRRQTCNYTLCNRTQLIEIKTENIYNHKGTNLMRVL